MNSNSSSSKSSRRNDLGSNKRPRSVGSCSTPEHRLGFEKLEDRRLLSTTDPNDVMANSPWDDSVDYFEVSQGDIGMARQPADDRLRAEADIGLATSETEGALAATVQITSVPNYGANGSMTGRVSGIDYTQYVVAPYIQIEGMGWWTKPLFASPTVPIRADGTFSAYVTTGGLDNRATIYYAAVIPATSTPPQAAGAGSLPVIASAVASDSFERYASTAQFAGLTWGVKEAPVGVGPGSNLFSNSSQNVWVNSEGMHLKIAQRSGQWYSAEVICLEPLGYGTYSIQTKGRTDNLDPNVTFGAFTWDARGGEVNGASANREIDFEDGRWANSGDPTNAQMVVQPWHVAGNLQRYTIPTLTDSSEVTRTFTWLPGRVDFSVLVDQSLIAQWTYLQDPARNHYVPNPGDARVRFNLWLNNVELGGARPPAPANGEPVEVVISDFSFTPLVPGITVSPVSGLVTSEDGAATTFTLKLDAQPNADVSIGLSSSDTSEAVVSPSSLTFTPTNWSEPQTVTVMGQDDDIADGDIPYTILTAAATSSDARYDGLNALDVLGQNNDNDPDSPTASVAGFYKQADSSFHLRESNERVGGTEFWYRYGPGGSEWIPLVGDWDGDGVDTTGFYRTTDSSFHLRESNARVGTTEFFYRYGPGGSEWIPIAGDWDGDGVDTPGFYRTTDSSFHLRESNERIGGTEFWYRYGPGGSEWIPLAGDWDGSGAALKLDGTLGSGEGLEPLTTQALQPIVDQAIADWITEGLDADSLSLLQRVEFVVADLPGGLLGLSTPGTITIDTSAAGRGWFVDPTPRDDQEFQFAGTTSSLKAIAPEAVDAVDLLTVVRHELGHVLGLKDLEVSLSDIMSESLQPGMRREL